MCSSQVTTAPLFTTSSTFVQPITGKGPPFRHLLSTVEAPRLFMLIEHDALPSFSSDPLSLLPECAHLTSFDSIPSTPLHTLISLGLDTAKPQALHAKSNVQLDAVTRYICNVGFGGAGKGDRHGHYPTPHGTVARTKESPGTFNAASNMARKFQLDDGDCKDIFIRCKTTDKNVINVNYTKGQEDHHPQSPYPSSGDAVLSFWETGPRFSYHGWFLDDPSTQATPERTDSPQVTTGWIRRSGRRGGYQQIDSLLFSVCTSRLNDVKDRIDGNPLNDALRTLPLLRAQHLTCIEQDQLQFQFQSKDPKDPGDDDLQTPLPQSRFLVPDNDDDDDELQMPLALFPIISSLPVPVHEFSWKRAAAHPPSCFAVSAICLRLREIARPCSILHPLLITYGASNVAKPVTQARWFTVHQYPAFLVPQWWIFLFLRCDALTTTKPALIPASRS
ncbi:uncharacterized protein C8R40DRAFT_1265375 [Lentinula edodes]|uniref:uncharacterized protein n=1 Tax=Lentinula edodes TaxID=5353 RepID=UPI001E8ECDD7|nr:uncharacterized protein C8R40DRAFT_1265375 [Lentinula edodes]KAH7875286.1 hypothetical protein C8R40DRAFT_1265375 [Lentinula edodes]